MEEIKIRGARIHNLKNIDLTIPKNKLVVITGISGSGKSSLAFDILFEEGKNQYLRSIGILSGLDKEDRFEELEGIGPTVSVRQNTIRQSNPRSTVGSKTGILNQLAFMFAADGKEGEEKTHFSPSDFLYTTADGMCIQCQGRGSYYDVNIDNLVLNKEEKLCELYQRLHVTSGFLRILKKKYGEHFETSFWNLPEEIREEVIYGTYENGKQSYCIERALKYAYDRGEDVEEIYSKRACPECNGERVGDLARNVQIEGKTIGELGKMTMTELLCYLQELTNKELSKFSQNVVKGLVLKIENLISFRLGHLTLYREMSTLSGGEIQRVFLHLHLESKLDSLIYVFDEPMAGLHPSEKQSMMEAVKQLRDIGNTVIVVEHDKEMIAQADHIIEIGPGAGVKGGTVVYQGNFEGYKKAGTLLSQYLSGEQKMLTVRKKRQTDKLDCLVLTHAKTHYLKDLTIEFPLHQMVGIAGLSGSGKSSLIEETLLKRLATAKKYGQAEGLTGLEHINGYTVIEQDPIGRNASSTPASYIGIWDKIRDLFAKQPEAIAKDMSAGYFSFHSKGACPECGGSGVEKIYLTADFSVEKICPVCHGKRFLEDSLQVNYLGKNINDILSMNIEEAVSFFSDQLSIRKPLEVLNQMGMGYLTLGQPTSSLSGGEAQRLKLAKELGRQHKQNILYILDEPTTGLSLYDTDLLLKLLNKLVETGNSIIVIEHNTEVLKQCDYIIELGPEGGDLGGEIVASGSPESLLTDKASKTGRYLA